MSFLSFSQSLTPIIQKLDKDTLFCFTISQSRELATLIVQGVYADSLANQLKLSNSRLSAAVENKQKQVDQLMLKVNYREQIAENQKESLKSLEQHLELRDQKLKKNKRQKRWMITGLVGLAILSFIN